MVYYKQKFESLEHRWEHAGNSLLNEFITSGRQAFAFAEEISSIPQLETSQTRMTYSDKAEYSVVRWQRQGERLPFFALTLGHGALNVVMHDEQYGVFARQDLAIGNTIAQLQETSYLQNKLRDRDIEVRRRTIQEFEADQRPGEDNHARMARQHKEEQERLQYNEQCSERIGDGLMTFKDRFDHNLGEVGLRELVDLRGPFAEAV